MDKPFAAYRGDEPYVFVCYAHDDQGVVYPEIGWLHEQGINLWYDEGISAGKNWRAAIGDSLLGASHVVFYISERSLASDHCNREINLALDEGKDIVPVYLESVDLTSDLKVGLTRVQALYRNQDANYQQHLLSALGKTVEETSDKPEPAPSGEPERRQLTVMYCNLADSTQLASQLDPEDYREVVRAYQSSCADVIQRYDGHIAQYLSDGVVVYFGWPQAHEDDADRAVRAGLDLVEVGKSHPATTVHVGVGIHTGLAVIGGVSSDDPTGQLALGETPHVASRLREIAEPNTVALSQSTHRLVEGQFEVEALSNVAGIPGSAVRVLSVRDRSRFEAAHGAHLTPLVGRVEELGMLRHRWSLAKEGEGQVVLLSGQPGIGKSRIAQAFVDEVAGESPVLFSLQCSPYHTQSAFYPMTQLLLARLALASEDDDAARLDKLAQWLSANIDEEPTTLHLIADLLSIASDPLELAPEKRKAETVAALVRFVVNQSTDVPILLVLEDAHWVDPSTEELFDEVVDRLQSLRVLMLVTHRPEFQSSWSDHGHVSQHSLNRLGRREAAEIVSMVAREALPESIRNEIVAKTDGIPLFVEELTKSVLESGSEHSFAVPSSLQDSLMANIDRLGAAKRIAQTGAAIGREFNYDLLQRVAGDETNVLQRHLGALVASGLVSRRGTPPEAIYTFKHALVQDAAYGSLLRGTRREIHARIAMALDESFPEQAAATPELVAHHYDRAGRVTEALSYYGRASDAAQARFSNLEAIAHLERSVELASRLPEGADRDDHDLRLHVNLGLARGAAYGFANEATGGAWERARVLCEKGTGKPAQLAAALDGLSVFHQNRSELDAAMQFGEQLLNLGRTTKDDGYVVAGSYRVGIAKFWRGRIRECLEDHNAALAIYDQKGPKSWGIIYTGNYGVDSCGYASAALWLLGYPDQAIARAEEGVGRARTLAHAFSLATALMWESICHSQRGEWKVAAEMAEECSELCERKGFALYRGNAGMIHAHAIAHSEGRDTLAEAMERLHGIAGTGARSGVPFLLSLVARIHQELGREADALGVVETALAASEQGGQPCYDAELLRLKGELSLSSNEAEAESLFRRALEMAQRQEAKSLELRAATSLARLWQKQGKKDEAPALVAPVYDWFTQGFDTKDLQEANALLEEA